MAKRKDDTYADVIVRWRNRGGAKRHRFAQFLLIFLFSFDMQPNVVVGKNVRFFHNGIGTIIHNKTEICDNAWIYHGVTLGNANNYYGEPLHEGRQMGRIIVKEGATICAGAKVLCSDGDLIIGKNAIVGANAVVTKSVPDNEVWAGVPAKCIRKRS